MLLVSLVRSTGNDNIGLAWFGVAWFLHLLNSTYYTIDTMTCQGVLYSVTLLYPLVRI